MAYKGPSHFEKILRTAKKGQAKQAKDKLDALEKNPKSTKFDKNKHFVKW